MLTIIDYKVIEFYKDDKLIGESRICRKTWYQCDDGRILTIEDGQIFQRNAKQTTEVKK